MTDKYKLSRKADFIGANILLHDLINYNEELQKPASDHKSFAHKLRYTRNVFMSLYNVKDMLDTVHIEGDAEFTAKKKALRRELEVVVHVRNKGVGHLDKEVLRRSAQWEPHIFHEDCKENPEFATFLCYKGLIETSINSYQTGRQGRKLFSSEIDLMYPPSAREFFEFLALIVQDSINWLDEARRLIRDEIKYHSSDSLAEMAAVAGQTNFNLREPAEIKVDGALVHGEFRSLMQELRKQGVAEPVLTQLENRLIQWERQEGVNNES